MSAGGEYTLVERHTLDSFMPDLTPGDEFSAPAGELLAPCAMA